MQVAALLKESQRRFDEWSKHIPRWHSHRYPAAPSNCPSECQQGVDGEPPPVQGGEESISAPTEAKLEQKTQEVKVQVDGASSKTNRKRARLNDDQGSMCFRQLLCLR